MNFQATPNVIQLYSKQSWKKILIKTNETLLFVFFSQLEILYTQRSCLESESVYPAKNKCSKNDHLAFSASLHICLPWRICLQSLYCIFFTFQLQWRKIECASYQHPFPLKVMKLFCNYFCVGCGYSREVYLATKGDSESQVFKAAF